MSVCEALWKKKWVGDALNQYWIDANGRSIIYEHVTDSVKGEERGQEREETLGFWAASVCARRHLRDAMQGRAGLDRRRRFDGHPEVAVHEHWADGGVVFWRLGVAQPGHNIARHLTASLDVRPHAQLQSSRLT